MLVLNFVEGRGCPCPSYPGIPVPVLWNSVSGFESLLEYRFGGESQNLFVDRNRSMDLVGIAPGLETCSGKVVRSIMILYQKERGIFMKKRLIVTVLTLILILSAVAGTVSADSFWDKVDKSWWDPIGTVRINENGKAETLVSRVLISPTENDPHYYMEEIWEEAPITVEVD